MDSITGPRQAQLRPPRRTGGAGGGAPGPQGPPGPTGPAGVGVPAGGTSGQVLGKTSSADYATGWLTPSGGGGGSRVWIGPTPPAAPVSGDTWWRNDPDGQLFVYYDDGSSQQWVPATPSLAGPQGPAGAPGATGPQGAQGPAGPGVPTGGATGTVLAKSSATDYATQWTALPTSLPPTGSAGGSLSGTYPNPSIAASGVGAGNYGGPTQIPMLTVAADGRITTAAQGAISLSGITAGGDLTGTYPNPTVAAGAVGNTEISDVAWSKVTGAPASFPPSGTAGGDLSGSYPNPQLGAGVILDADINAAAGIVGTKLADAPNGVPTAKINDLAVTDAKIAGVAYSKVTGHPSSYPPSGTASGDLSGTYPGPTVAKLNGAAVGTTTPLARGDVLVANATPALARLALGASGTVLQSNGTDAVYGAAPASPPNGAATGDLSGTYPAPTVAKLNGAALGTTTPLARGDILVADGTPALKRLALGAASTVLQSNGTDLVYGASLGGPPSGTAGGDLSGTYPNPTVGALKITDAKVNDVAWGKITGAPTTYPIAVGTTAPASPTNGTLWFRTDPDCMLFVYYNDGTSSQWVPAVGQK